MRIAISDPRGFLKGRARRVRKNLGAILDRERAAGDFAFAYVDDRAISRLHEVYFGRRGPTDVISFPLGEDTPDGTDRWVGEVVVSGQTARRVARELGVDPQRELLRYSIHGLLHLIGYEDRFAGSRAVLKEREERYLRLVAPRSGHEKASLGGTHR